MIIFWIAAALLSAGAGALMLRGAVRARPVAGEDPALAVHRRQLAEIDDLAERGLLGEVERKAARAEAGRRLLEAADASTPQPSTSPHATDPKTGRLIVLALAGLAPLIAVALYLTVAGSPGAPDQPFEARVAAWKGHEDQLDWNQRAAVATVEAARRPRDPTVLKDLAVAQLFADDAASAEATARRALAIAPNDPEVYTVLAAAFTREAGGLTPSAREALNRAQALAAALPPTDPLRQRVDEQVRGVNQMASEAAGPARAGAQAQVTPEMIRQMVRRLDARLKANPDDPQGWVMLVRAYSVLGETARRDETLTSARARYAGNKDILAALDQAKGAAQ